MKNQYILKFLQDAEKGLLDNVPNDIPLAGNVWKDEAHQVVDKSFKYCRVKRCIVCGTRHPIVHHHVFNQGVASIIGVLNRQFLVKLCPNCHTIVHECGTSRRTRGVTIQAECIWHTKFFGKPLIMSTRIIDGKDGIASEVCPDCWRMLFPDTKYPNGYFELTKAVMIPLKVD